MNFALHHRGSGVVLDVAFPSCCLLHLMLLGNSKTLFSKVLYSVVVSVGHKVLDPEGLSMCLQPIHQPGSVPLDLL